jgi:hypothetical protein
VWDNSAVAGTELLMLLAIADQTNDDGTDAWPSVKNLAQRTRLNERTVQRVIQRLVTGGHLLVKEGGGRRRNRYSILMTAPTCPQPEPDGRLSTAPAERHPRRSATGDTGDISEVAQLRHRTPGTAVSPVTSYPILSPSSPATPNAANAPEHGRGRHQVPDSRAAAVLARLGPKWRLSPRQVHWLAPRVSDALTAGWTEYRLVEHLSTNSDGVRSPAAVLAARLDDLPSDHGDRATGGRRSPWCGLCDGPDPHERFVATDDGRLTPCPRCHPRSIQRPADGRRPEGRRDDSPAP